MIKVKKLTNYYRLACKLILEKNYNKYFNSKYEME